MTKKYKLTEKYIECLGVKLFQIQALAAFFLSCLCGRNLLCG